MTQPPSTPERDKYCGARKHQGEGTCTRPAGWGTDHPGYGKCKLHGGATPNHGTAADREKVLEAVRTFGLPLDVSPTEALLDEVKWTAGHVAWLRDRIQEFEAEALSWGRSSEVRKGSGEFPGTDTTYTAAPPVLLDLYQRERRHLLDVCRVAIGAGLAERQVRLAERQGELIAGAIQGILADLNLTKEQQALVSTVVPMRLRELEHHRPGLRPVPGGEMA